MTTIKHRAGGDDPQLRRARRQYPVTVIAVTFPAREVDEARALIWDAAKAAGMNATRWAADRLLVAARKELGK